MGTYLIRGLCHRTDIPLGVHGFYIDLHPDWPSVIAESGLDQTKVNSLIEAAGQSWLNAAGYGREVDGRRLYEPHHAIRVQWGKWGPEHICVPGNACGLDIERGSFGNLFRGGARLSPHNVDSLSQKYLLLIVFTELAADAVLFATRD